MTMNVGTRRSTVVTGGRVTWRNSFLTFIQRRDNTVFTTSSASEERAASRPRVMMSQNESEAPAEDRKGPSMKSLNPCGRVAEVVSGALDHQIVYCLSRFIAFARTAIQSSEIR